MKVIFRLVLFLVFHFTLSVELLAQNKPWLDSILYVLDNKLDEKERLANMNRVSQSLWSLSRYEESDSVSNEVLRLTEKETYIPGEDSVFITARAYCFINMGSARHMKAKLAEALDYYLKAEQMAMMTKNLHLQARILNNIGEVYRSTEEFENALKYHQQSLDIRLKVGSPKEHLLGYMGIGTVHLDMEEYDVAFDYMQKAYNITIEHNLEYHAADLLIRMGVVKMNLEEYEEALNLLNQALEASHTKSSGTYQAYVHTNLAEVYQKMGDTEQAIAQYILTRDKADENGIMQLQVESRQSLAEIYKQEGRYAEAYDELEDFAELSDSLTRITQIEEIEAKYQSTMDSLKIEKLEAERDEQTMKTLQERAIADKERIQKYGLIGGLVLVVFFAIFLFSRFRVISKQRDLIELQKAQVDEKNREVIDSIQYAKRIQSAVLPSPGFISRNLEESFVLYKPKDIVAGDFYWMEAEGGKVFFTAADCTGHGVPGAMVSVMCSHALTKAVKELGLQQPSRILDKTVELLEERFARSEEEVNDGMDLALCSIDIQNNLLEYAGANNPLYYIRDGELQIIKADKQPVGKYSDRKPYTNHQLEMRKGDCYYVFTDGYPDQFGGSNGKKFKYKAFRDLLLSVHDKPMTEQHDIINQVFEDWKGELEQIDDVCVFGVRV